MNIDRFLSKHRHSDIYIFTDEEMKELSNLIDDEKQELLGLIEDTETCTCPKDWIKDYYDGNYVLTKKGRR